MADENEVEITKFYMIGDNPHADIKGGNENECVSILVRTGVWNGGVNDEENPAHFVVNDIVEAYKLILEKENLSEFI